MHATWRSIGASLAIVCISPSAAAAGKDAATLKEIDLALKTHYSAAKYEKADGILRTAIRTCGAKSCSREVLAKVYVALGVVRAKAAKDQTGALKAFKKAKELDRNVELDTTLVSPPVAVAFYKIMGRELPPELVQANGNGAPVGKLKCVPASNYEIQTAQPIAVVCEPLEGVVRAELHYRFTGETEYTALLMSVQDGTLRANIPCEALTKPGSLRLYVIGQDFNKEKIDTFGSVASPAQYNIVTSTKAPVPSYPGEAAPKRCDELLVGVGSQGEACTAVQPCKYGLFCTEGMCQKAPACETDSDCASESCVNGFCAMNNESPNARTIPKQWMVGLHGGLDFWVASSAQDVCGEASLRAGDFSCYNSGESRVYNDTSVKSNRLPMTDPDSAGDLDPGLRVATVRLMASADYVLKKYLSVGVRLGWAFGGGPRAIHYDSAGYPSRKGRFVPIHAEARGTLWLRSLGKEGLHPNVHLSLGMAEVDANTPISVWHAATNRKLDAWRRMGPAFVGAGFGMLYDVNQTFGVQLNIDAMYMLPATGLVCEPSLGGVVGF